MAYNNGSGILTDGHESGFNLKNENSQNGNMPSKILKMRMRSSVYLIKKQ